jgi:hypothetical protein
MKIFKRKEVIMLLRIIILSLFSVLFIGCNSQLDQVTKNIENSREQESVIPDRMRDNSIKILKYGDYYMKEYSNNSNFDTLKIGESLMLQEMDIFDSDAAKTLPMIREKEGEIIKRCNASASNYTISYFRIGLALNSYLRQKRNFELYNFGDSSSIDKAYSMFQKRWAETLQFIEQMIKDCYL